jgi:hypothetical protein
MAIVVAFMPVLVAIVSGIWIPTAMIHETFGVHYVPYQMMRRGYYFVRNAHLFGLIYAYPASLLVDSFLAGAREVSRFQAWALTVYTIQGLLLVAAAAAALRSRLAAGEKFLVLAAGLLPPFVTPRLINPLTLNYHMLEAVLYLVLSYLTLDWVRGRTFDRPSHAVLLGAFSAVAVGTKLTLLVVIAPFFLMLCIGTCASQWARLRAAAWFTGAFATTFIVGLVLYFRLHPSYVLRYAIDMARLSVDPQWLVQSVIPVSKALRRWLSWRSMLFGFSIIATSSVAITVLSLLTMRFAANRRHRLVVVMCAVVGVHGRKDQRRVRVHEVVHDRHPWMRIDDVVHAQGRGTHGA